MGSPLSWSHLHGKRDSLRDIGLGAFNQAFRLQGRHTVHKDWVCALFFGTATAGSHYLPHPYIEDFNLRQKRLTHLNPPTSLFLISMSVCSPHAGVCYHINLQVHCTFLLLFLDLFDFHVYECFSSMYICAPYVCQVHSEDRRGHWIP